MIYEGLNSSDLPSDVNIMAHISSCRRALSQWRRQNNMNSYNQEEDLKEKWKLCTRMIQDIHKI